MSEIQQQMRWILHKPVIMVGMMGAGKTAVGRALAAALDVPFRDSDIEIEAAAAMSVQEIFERDGEPFFRDREAEVIARLLDESPCVLSTGGGAFLSPRNREQIAAHGVSVWLDASVALLWERVRHKTTRPLLRTPDPQATLAALFAERTPIYAQAEIRVPSLPELSIESMADRVLEVLAQRKDILEPVNG